MAKYKQIEFAKLCGVGRTYLPPYIKSGHLIIEDGLIDESNPVNQLFLQKRLAKKLSEKSYESEQNIGQNSELDEESTILEVRHTNKRGRKTGSSGSISDAIMEMNDLKNAKLQEEIELLKKRNMKMDGESIPTAAVTSVFSFFGKAFTHGTQELMENFLNQISTRKGLSSVEYAEFRGILIKGINDIATRANKESKKNINNIIKEVSLTRGVGEHD